jgi:hypothetical protein
MSSFRIVTSVAVVAVAVLSACAADTGKEPEVTLETSAALAVTDPNVLSLIGLYEAAGRDPIQMWMSGDPNGNPALLYYWAGESGTWGSWIDTSGQRYVWHLPDGSRAYRWYAVLGAEGYAPKTLRLLSTGDLFQMTNRNCASLFCPRGQYCRADNGFASCQSYPRCTYGWCPYWATCVDLPQPCAAAHTCPPTVPTCLSQWGGPN